jgi:hypothetical protein
LLGHFLDTFGIPRACFTMSDSNRKLLVPPAAEPYPGTLALYTEAVIRGGADELFRAHREAARLSKKFGETFEPQWCLTTPWRSQLSVTHRARARYALTWRPRFLATLALSRSQSMAPRAAKVSHVTARRHRREDPDFEAQCIAAEEHAVTLLHDVAFRSAPEGECQPVFWQGVRVGHIRKYDSRLQIEMLRAHMSDKLKTPGSKINIDSGNSLKVGMVMGAKEIAEIQAMRQESLRHMAETKAQAVVGACVS